MVKITYKGETRNIPKRYLPDTLTPSQRKKQIKSIFEGTDRPKLDVKPRKSSNTILFNKKYGKRFDKLKGGKSVDNIAKVVGLPYKALKEVFEKGEGAYYSSGSRPNQSAQSWAYGRLYAYIMGDKEVRDIDKAITKKYKVDFSKIKK
tara:strand:+ start:3060 stop:3503 length:444 start_codon:yes stop_codon:yes gene_type:complete